MIAAVVVLYHPQLEALERLLRSVVDQVDMVFLADNTPEPPFSTAAFAAAFSPRVFYIPLMNNTGVWAAQNVGIERSIAASCTHVLLLDDDSVLPQNMVKLLLDGEAALLREGKRVAGVGPQLVEEKTGRRSPALLHRYVGIRKIILDPNSATPVETDHLIASGAVIRTTVLQHVGLMREDMFMDWGDIEWHLRARSMGYKSYYVPCAVMNHSVGDSVVRILGRDVHLHSDVRNYYMLRNAMYLFRLKSVGLKWKINFAPKIPCYLLLYPIFSKHRLQNLRLILMAFRDGLLGRLGKLQNVAEQR